ncbi:MAG: right-handed parallel beta-helix repeat-containing protein, partial [Candidatus Eisenbacteria bacterium]|nr:right-handed parallel beta-helix repeat-containing protein [Candidatus Eisenbacteria bacterium]
MKRYLAPGLSVLLLSIGTAAWAATITVTSGTDPIDIDWQTATIDDLPGPDGKVSFSEAMIASNNTPGADVIAFALPPSEWQMQWLFPNRAVIHSTYTFFWRAYDAVTIDGTTQTEATGDTNPDGAEVVLYGGEVYLNVDDCAYLGIDSGSVNINGSRSIARGNTGGINITYYGGSGGLIEDNIGGTLKLDRTSENVVVGNIFNRIRVLGWVGGGQPDLNNRIGGPAPEDRNYITGLGSYSSEGYPGGFSMQIFDAVGTVIENNSIGSTPDGMESGTPGASVGIRFEGENHDTTIRDNRIAGVLGIGIGPHHAGQLYGWAIYLGGSGSGVTIQGNTIGLDAEGVARLGSVIGIDSGATAASTITDIRIGGTGPGEGNVVAGHRLNGITVGRDVEQTRISGNSIYENAALGIDLLTSAGQYGLSPNDPLDGDAGGNGLQNFPVITSASTNGAVVEVLGSLQSSPSSAFSLEFFASPECDANGFGEGKVFLGSHDVVTDTGGDAAFQVILPASVSAGWVITATATLEPLGATSEFSACVVAEPGGAASVPADGAVEEAGIRLHAASPTPFRGSTTIKYELPASGQVRLVVFDASGRLVRTLAEGSQQPGVHQLAW